MAAKIELPPYETIALVLQGGGALGSYQAGVYQGLHEVGILPNWFAGISIGAINAAILAGNAPDERGARLTEFWETICRSAFLPDPTIDERITALAGDGPGRAAISAIAAGRALLGGQDGFFTPRVPPPFLWPFGGIAATSYYDTQPLKQTLERLVDFDRINARETRLSVGAVDIETGNFAYFDNATMKIAPEHIMASGALPPGFPAIEIDGRFYWDGGLVSNTPLTEVLSHTPRRDTIAFQVDLWSADGPRPNNILDVAEREKDIRYSSRTRMATDAAIELQCLRRALKRALDCLPAAAADPEIAALRDLSCSKVYNIIHLIYRDKHYEAQHKDYEFSLPTMREHWEAGLTDIRRTLRHPEWLERPRGLGVVTHDVHRGERRTAE
ncbi:MAG TPA: patatin-like phospholipase family protein [Dongiaceae bacterium]|nr:patatin-like phospholipase family protein [Dongiaceae bacterium]